MQEWFKYLEKSTLQSTKFNIVHGQRKASDNNVLSQCKTKKNLNNKIPKFYNNIFSFVGLTTLGTFIEF